MDCRKDGVDIMKKTREILHIYSRVSTQGQENDGTSLASQLDMGIKRAKSLGMGWEHHNEKAASSSKNDLDNRPVIRELLARVSEGDVKHIYVYSIDRLSRNQNTAVFIRETLRKAKCTLYTNTNETNLESHEQNLLFGIISEIAQYENLLRKERLNHGKRVKARQGYWMGGPTPFGYKTSNSNKLILDKEQSKWVKRDFKWYSEGLSPKDIKHRLDGNILTNRGKPIWSYGSVEAILRNSHPNGSYVYYDKKIPCPRIVDKETWERVQVRLTEKKRLRGNQVKVYSYPLREIMYCSHCGSQMTGRSQKYSVSRTLISYNCPTHNRKWKESSVRGDWTRGKFCQNNVSMEFRRTESGVWETLINILRLSYQQRETFKKAVLGAKNRSEKTKINLIERKTDEIARIRNSISLLEEKIAENEVQRISKRDQANRFDLLIEKITVEIERLSSSLIENENELFALENDNLWIDWVKDYQSNMDKLLQTPESERIGVIKNYVKRIDVTFNSETRSHTLKLQLKLPLINDNFEWKNESRKSNGYRIQVGEIESKLELNNQVRNLRNVGEC